MTAVSELPDLLDTLSDSLSSAIDCLPSSNTLNPPPDSLSLLDLKNELLLSYLQNLTFFIIYKLRNQKSEPQSQLEEQIPSHNDIVKNLATLRLYLEKGVRPLEARLKYQLDKLLLAASDASTQPTPANGSTTKKSQNPSSQSNISDEEPPPTLPPNDLSYRRPHHQ